MVMKEVDKHIWLQKSLAFILSARFLFFLGVGLNLSKNEHYALFFCVNIWK